MHNKRIAALLLAVVLTLSACGTKNSPVSDVDYAKAENWAWNGIGEDKAVDAIGWPLTGGMTEKYPQIRLSVLLPQFAGKCETEK